MLRRFLKHLLDGESECEKKLKECREQKSELKTKLRSARAKLGHCRNKVEKLKRKIEELKHKLKPIPAPDKKEKRDWKKIRDLLREQLPKASNARIYLVDRDYWVTTKEEVKRFLKEDKTDLHKYVRVETRLRRFLS